MALRETIGNKRKLFKKTRNSDPKIRRNRAKSIISHRSPQQHVAAASEPPSGATSASGSRENKATTESTNSSRTKMQGKSRRRPPFHITNNSSSSTTLPTTDRAVPDTAPVSGGKGKRTPFPVARVKVKPTRFSHPRLDAVLRRLGRAWLSPGDDLYHAVLARSYRGMRFLPREELPRSVHRGFRRYFDDLNDAGLFMYDTVQAGGKRLSRTFVTRTLVGDAGITYKYLGLRLFAHPWNSPSDFRVGPGDKLADTLSDPCLADLFGEVSDKGGIGLDVGGTLRGVRELSEWMRIRAEGLLDDEVSGQEERGSCAFNLTLINRMESAACKRDLKPDPMFDMGKCSVSWHADSCLEDFSAIGVYHCTEPVPAEPDWGIALRVSQEDDGGGIVDGGSGDANPHDAVTSKRKRKSGRVDATTSRSSEERREGVLTPPLLVPLRSGDAYFLLDDFNHFHEHAVVSGRSTLRYSSTHRVATVEGNTFYHVQRRCEEVLAGSAETVDAGGRRNYPKANPRRQIFDVAQVRAEQSLLTELESEWLNQFWVQGRRHASLHPWWRGPMALMLATWRELERRTAVVVGRLLSLEHGGAEPEPAVVAKAFETVLRALEERRESRSRWISRFSDSVYRSLPPDCVPVVPMLWGHEHSSISRNSVGALEGEERDPEVKQEIIEGLPEDLASVILRLRECYKKVFRAACGGEKATSAKAIASGAASNWELFRAAGGRKERHEGGVARPRDVAKKNSGISRRSPVAVSGAGVVPMSGKKIKGKSKKRRR